MASQTICRYSFRWEVSYGCRLRGSSLRSKQLNRMCLLRLGASAVTFGMCISSSSGNSWGACGRGYLQPLRAEHSPQDLQREFGQDLDTFHELCNSMIQYRIRMKTSGLKNALAANSERAQFRLDTLNVSKGRRNGNAIRAYSSSVNNAWKSRFLDRPFRKSL